MKLGISRRLYIHEVLDGRRKHGVWHRLVDNAIIILILVNAAAVILESIPGWSTRYAGLFTAIEIVSVGLFTVEYVLRVWSCVEDRARDYRHPVWGRLRYMVSPLAVIDLIAILPFYLAFLIPVDLRMLRVARLARLLKITRYSQALGTLGAVIYAERRSLLGAVMLMTIILLIASSIMHSLEHQAQPDVFGSIPEAFWWGIVTLTTVGYGDVTPVTPWGRVFGALVTVIGVGIFAIPTAILAAGFARELGKRDFAVTLGLLTKVPVFSRLDPSGLALVATLLEPRSLPPRYAILRRGERPDAIHFILSGAVEIDLPHGIIRLGPGEFFGETAVLADDQKPDVSVTTVTPVQTLVLDAERFHDLADEVPDLSRHLAEIARQRAEG
ncbi:MAG: cyclic nucleotide-gated ion channel [Inquilinaceae bacterium]